MATDAGDIAGIAGSTASGAAAGFAVGGPIGGLVGGGIGFVGGLFSNAAENEAEELAALQAEREKAAALLSGEAREISLLLNSLAVQRKRRQFAQRAFLSQESARAGESILGLVNSSIARNTRASISQQLSENLQFSFLTETLGKQISQLEQEAINEKLGLNGEDTANASFQLNPALSTGVPMDEPINIDLPTPATDTPSNLVSTPVQTDTPVNFTAFDLNL